jgi:pSer/pThr/pTyr-binding forkhead associated (FHA) protein
MDSMATLDLADVVARWGTMYGGFFGLAVVLAVILLVMDVVGPILVWFDGRRRRRNPAGWIGAMVALPLIAMLPAVFFLTYSPIIGTFALALPLAVMSMYLFASAAGPEVAQPVAVGMGMQAQPLPAAAPAPQLSAPQMAPLGAAPVAAPTRMPPPAPASTELAGTGALAGLMVASSGPDRGKEFRLEEGASMDVGREEGVQMRLADPEASRRHARIRVDAGSVKLTDLASTNGTFVNGTRVTEAELKEGDVVRIGVTEMTVKLLASKAMPTTGTLIKEKAKPAKPRTFIKQAGAWTATIVEGPDAGETVALVVPVHVGRDDDCELVLSDPSTSRKHAIISVVNGGVMVEDLGSSNGTEIVRADGATVRVLPGKPQPVASGEKVRLGDTTLEFTEPHA